MVFLIFMSRHIQNYFVKYVIEAYSELLCMFMTGRRYVDDVWQLRKIFSVRVDMLMFIKDVYIIYVQMEQM